MVRYLKRAFFATVKLPVFGRVPLNLFIVALAFAAGFNREWRAVWLFGAWVEFAYLWVLVTNKRFQNAVDAEVFASEQSDPDLQRRRLISQLTPDARARLETLARKSLAAVEAARRGGTEEYELQSQRDGLDRMSWFYLKLLLARQLLMTQEPNAAGSQLRRQISELEQQLVARGGSEAVRQSKQETLRILNRRLELLQRRGQALEEIDADLARIEAQADLAVENAALGPQSMSLAGNITLASAMLETDLFGASQSAVDSLDRTFGPGEPVNRPETEP